MGFGLSLLLPWQKRWTTNDLVILHGLFQIRHGDKKGMALKRRSVDMCRSRLSICVVDFFFFCHTRCSFQRVYTKYSTIFILYKMFVENWDAMEILSLLILKKTKKLQLLFHWNKAGGSQPGKNKWSLAKRTKHQENMLSFDDMLEVMNCWCLICTMLRSFQSWKCMVENCALGIQSSSENGYAFRRWWRSVLHHSLWQYDGVLKETLRVELFGVKHLYVTKMVGSLLFQWFLLQKKGQMSCFIKSLLQVSLEFSEYVKQFKKIDLQFWGHMFQCVPFMRCTCFFFRCFFLCQR